MTGARQKYLHNVRSLVIKLGTAVLSNDQGRLDSLYLASIASQIAALRARGLRVTIVSSGAIGAGMAELNLPRRPTDLAQLQAVAAVGQRRLMDAWAAAFSTHQIHVAQILLTREDIDDRLRYLNLRNTVGAAHELGCIPIINENDTISTDELAKISFGDNDILAAMVTHALRAQLLVLLSVVDGILDSSSSPVRLIERVEDARELVRLEKTAAGKGGFASKLQAAQMVTDGGEAIIVAHGRTENVLPRLLDGEELGTLFVPGARKLSSRSRWIGSVRAAGAIHVDAGAVRAIVQNNRSLLPAGITRVEGGFVRGDVVEIRGPDGIAVARGLCNYAAADVQRISGKKTAEVRALLADEAYDEVIHRDNLVVG